MKRMVPCLAGLMMVLVVATPPVESGLVPIDPVANGAFEVFVRGGPVLCSALGNEDVEVPPGTPLAIVDTCYPGAMKASGWSSPDATAFSNYHQGPGEGPDREVLIRGNLAAPDHNLWQAFPAAGQGWSLDFDGLQFTVEAGTIAPSANIQVGFSLSPGRVQHPFVGVFWEGALRFTSSDMAPSSTGVVGLDPVAAGDIICPAAYTPCEDFRTDFGASDAAGKAALLGQARIVQLSFWNFNRQAGQVIFDDVHILGGSTAAEQAAGGNADLQPPPNPLDPFLPGVTDQNDGWIHVVKPRNALVEDGAVVTILPDANNKLVFDQEVWYIGANGELPYRLNLGDASRFPHMALAFAGAEELAGNLPTVAGCGPDAAQCIGPAATFFSTEGQWRTALDGGFTMRHAIPFPEFKAAIGEEFMRPFSVWSSVNYVPRDPTTGMLHSGGAPSAVRTDHPGANDAACRAGSATPWTDCPESGSFFSWAKNAAFFAAFGAKDPYANDGDASGTPFGASDAATGLVDPSSSGRGSEAGLKGHADRAEHGLTGLFVYNGFPEWFPGT